MYVGLAPHTTLRVSEITLSSYTGDKEKASKCKYYAIRTLDRVSEETVLNSVTQVKQAQCTRKEVRCSWQVLLCMWFKNVLADRHKTSRCQLLECVAWSVYEW